jgi:methionyl-tRNA formyltransferase
MKTLFYGTPSIAVPFLEQMAGQTQVVGVVSQPDRPKGRSLETQPTPVAAKARELGLTLHQPEKPSEIAATLKALAPDLAVAVAYGRILKKDILAVPRLGTLNVHFSLLPKYRGAAPVQWALAKGETKTGVTIFWLDEGMDTGPIFVKEEVDIDPEDDAGSLLDKLARRSLAALSETLKAIERREIIKVPQAGASSLAPLIKKDDARISLTQPARDIHNTVRAFSIWPKAFLELEGGKRLIVLKTGIADSPGEDAPGRIVSIDRNRGVLVQCGLGSRLWFLSVQPEGKKPVNAVDFINGLRLAAGDFLPIITK